MWIFKVLTLAVLSLTAIAGKAPVSGKFEKHHPTTGSSTPLQLDDAFYDDLTESPRDYTVAVLLTALEARFGCQLCRDFQPEWDLVAKSWNKGDKSGRLRVLFGTLDFAHGKGTFQKVFGYFHALRHVWFSTPS